MQPSTKAKLLWIVASLLGIAALGFALFAFALIKGGAYPPEGTGSLGHVGMVIAGIIGAFLALIFGGLMLFCVSKAKIATRASKQFTGNGTGE